MSDAVHEKGICDCCSLKIPFLKIRRLPDENIGCKDCWNLMMQDREIKYKKELDYDRNRVR